MVCFERHTLWGKGETNKAVVFNKDVPLLDWADRNATILVALSSTTVGVTMHWKGRKVLWGV